MCWLLGLFGRLRRNMIERIRNLSIEELKTELQILKLKRYNYNMQTLTGAWTDMHPDEIIKHESIIQHELSKRDYSYEITGD